MSADSPNNDAFRRTAVTTLARPFVPGFAMVIVFQIVAALAGIAPLLAVVEVGRILLSAEPYDSSRAWTVVTLGALGLVVRLVFTAASSGAGHLLDDRVQLSLRRRLARHLGRAPIGWLSEKRTGDLAKVVGEDVGAVHPFIAHAPSELVSAFVVPAVSLVYLFTVDWRLTLVTLIPVVLAMSLVPLLMMAEKQRAQTAFDSAMGRIANSVVEFVEGIAVVKAFGGSQRAHSRFIAAVDDFVDIFTKWVRGVSGVAAGMSLALSPPFVLLTILTGGAVLVTNGSLDPADLLPFLLLGLGLTAPVAALGHGFDDLQAAGRALGRIRDVLSVQALPDPADPLVPNGHRVEFRNVTFGYTDDHEVLRDIDLVLEPGTLTAIVGPSGSGKSTLAALLPRFHDTTGGSILLGGVDLREIAPHDLYRSIAFVFQDVRLLRTSVAENIALAVPRADMTDIVQAARRANIHQRILELPRGYDTIVGDEVRLSGGESQRLSLARAFLADTPVLVLDEATAFADPQTEAAVRQNLRASGDRTVLTIAHRPETIADADSVVMLQTGSIAEIGTPAELLARGGAFAAFWEGQRTMTDHDTAEGVR
ncbi:ABC transporter ATP-binding protein [Rhodococcus sp. NPDC058521]|uniref:ABC transporter ATP-binding protein n=1 Tax=Rhodococcus sp. NPDC058521 TaxID=3346536 RepID=UPI00365A4670